MKLFVDQVEVATGTLAGALHSGIAPVRIGADEAGSYFEGMIDEVRVMGVDESATLGQTEAHYRYNARNQLTVEYTGAFVAEPTDPPADVSVKTYSYDKNGNVTKIEEKVGTVVTTTEDMTYDKLNRMTQHSGPAGTESFSYRGAEWHRYTADGKTFLYDGDNVLADISGGFVDAFYVTPFLDQNLSLTQNGSTYYYSQDGLGSVRTLTNDSGDIQNTYDFMPFGRPYAPRTSIAVKQRYTYTGRERNPVSALMYYRYRQYDPGVGRFGARDPIGYRGGIGLYVYVWNRSVSNGDPYGLWCRCCEWKVLRSEWDCPPVPSAGSWTCRLVFEAEAVVEGNRDECVMWQSAQWEYSPVVQTTLPDGQPGVAYPAPLIDSDANDIGNNAPEMNIGGIHGRMWDAPHTTISDVVAHGAQFRAAGVFWLIGEFDATLYCEGTRTTPSEATLDWHFSFALDTSGSTPRLLCKDKRP